MKKENDTDSSDSTTSSLTSIIDDTVPLKEKLLAAPLNLVCSVYVIFLLTTELQ